MRKTLLFGIVFIIFFSPNILGEGKRAFTLADLYALKSVANPQISPDGTRIVFVSTQFNMEEGKADSNLFMIRSDGTGLRQLTYDPAEDSHPRWSPDGQTILFVSMRNEGSQVWLLPADGGEARQLTHISTGVSSPEWSPDGRKILFASDVFPECGADDACNKEIQEAMDKGPLHAHMTDRLLYRHWNFYKDGKRTHTLVLDIEAGEVTDVTPGDYDAPGFSISGSTASVFSPDGQEICFVSNHDAKEAESTNMDLWVVPIGGGSPINITAENPAWDGAPQYSPDGRYIAYLTQKIAGYESDRFRLAVYDRQTRKHRILTEDFNNWISEYVWSPDSRYIFFTAAVKTHYPLYRVDVKTGNLTPMDHPLLDFAMIRSIGIAPHGGWFVFSHSSIGEPYELWRFDTDTKSLKRLTYFNKSIEDTVDIRPAESAWVKGADNTPIQVFIIKPHDFNPNRKYPAILNIHGGPQGMWADSFRGDWQVYPGAGYVVVLPNPRGSIGFGQEFTAAISKDWGGKVMKDIELVVNYMETLPYVDPERMGAMGWSWGGYAMMWLEGHTDRFKALVAMMGVYDLPSMYGSTEELWFPEWDLGGTPWDSDLYTKFSPSQYVANFKTPCLVITGERDYRVPYTQSLQFFTALQKRGVPSRLIIFTHDGHWPSHVKSMPFYYNAHLDWFHRYLGGAPPPYDMMKMWRNQAFSGKDNATKQK